MTTLTTEWTKVATIDVTVERVSDYKDFYNEVVPAGLWMQRTPTGINAGCDNIASDIPEATKAHWQGQFPGIPIDWNWCYE